MQSQLNRVVLNPIFHRVGNIPFSSLSGMLAPLIFWAGVIVVGWLQTDYNALADTVSKMGRVGRPYAWIANATLIVTGLLIAFFAYGLPHEKANSSYTTRTQILFAAFGLFGLAGAGLMPCDEYCEGMSAANIFHTLPVAIGFTCLQFALLQFAKMVERSRSWVRMPVEAFAIFWAGIIALLAFILGRWGVVPPLEAVSGLSEKMYLAFLFEFIFRLAKRSFPPSKIPVP